MMATADQVLEVHQSQCVCASCVEGAVSVPVDRLTNSEVVALLNGDLQDSSSARFSTDSWGTETRITDFESGRTWWVGTAELKWTTVLTSDVVIASYEYKLEFSNQRFSGRR